MTLPERSGQRIEVVGTRRQLLPGAALAASSSVVSVRPGSADEPERVSDASGRWSIERAQQWYGRQPWLSGCNYMPSTAINQLEMFQEETFDPAVIDREFGLAEELGFNSVRVFLHDLLWQQDSAGFLGRCERVLQLAEAHGIRVMFVLFDSCWHPLPRLGRQPQPLPHTHNSGWVQSPGIEVLQQASEWGRLREYVQGV